MKIRVQFMGFIYFVSPIFTLIDSNRANENKQKKLLRTSNTSDMFNIGSCHSQEKITLLFVFTYFIITYLQLTRVNVRRYRRRVVVRNQFFTISELKNTEKLRTTH